VVRRLGHDVRERVVEMRLITNLAKTHGAERNDEPEILAECDRQSLCEPPGGRPIALDSCMAVGVG
jgi:hypothetical protein